MDRYGAIVMHRYGPPSVLVPGSANAAALRPDEVRLQAIASAVNHSDLEIRCGNWPIRREPPFPYVPGLEVVGRVVEVGTVVTDLEPGDVAITMMMGLGGVRAERAGGYAEFVTVPAHAAARVPTGVDPIPLAALGLAAVTAAEGLRKLGDLQGRRIVITGASGGVGSAAVGLARAHGAEVTAVVSHAARAEYVRSIGAHRVVLAREVVGGALGTAQVDGVLDTVAGEAFGRCVAALRAGGTLSLVGAVGGSDVRFEAYSLLEVQLTGYSSESLDGPSLRRALTDIATRLQAGQLVPPAVTTFPLLDAASAHQALEEHRIQGRILLVPPA